MRGISKRAHHWPSSIQSHPASFLKFWIHKPWTQFSFPFSLVPSQLAVEREGRERAGRRGRERLSEHGFGKGKERDTLWGKKKSPIGLTKKVCSFRKKPTTNSQFQFQRDSFSSTSNSGSSSGPKTCTGVDYTHYWPPSHVPSRTNSLSHHPTRSPRTCHHLSTPSPYINNLQTLKKICNPWSC